MLNEAQRIGYIDVVIKPQVMVCVHILGGGGKRVSA